MSGRRNDRDAIIETEVQPISARLPLEDLTAVFVRPDVALVTCVSEDEADGPWTGARFRSAPAEQLRLLRLPDRDGCLMTSLWLEPAW